MAYKKKFNIFYILDAIANTKEDVTEHPNFEKEYNIFMINKWLSMSSAGVFVSYFADQIRSMTKEQHFYFVRELIGKHKHKVFFKYAKGNKKNKKVKIIMDYYKISEEKANEFVNILSTKQLKTLEKSFGGRTGKK